MWTRDRRDLRSSWIAAVAFGLVVQVYPPAATAAAPPASPPTVQAAGVIVSPAVLAEVRPDAPGSRTVALTFDDGPDPRWTPRVLDLLARYGAVATFCVVGENAAHHEDLVRRIVDAGMRLCNHSRSHDLLLATRPDDALEGELVDVQSELAARSGAPVPYFRAPGGNWSEPMLRMAAAHGMQPLGWSVDSRDWRRPGVAEIVSRVQQQVHPGAVVLLHDGGGQRDQTVAALEQLLPWLAANCYGFSFPVP